jgi:hypothetical protein
MIVLSLEKLSMLRHPKRTFCSVTANEIDTAERVLGHQVSNSLERKDAALRVGCLRPSTPIGPLNDAPHRPAVRNRRS